MSFSLVIPDKACLGPRLTIADGIGFVVAGKKARHGAPVVAQKNAHAVIRRRDRDVNHAEIPAPDKGLTFDDAGNGATFRGNGPDTAGLLVKKRRHVHEKAPRGRGYGVGIGGGAFSGGQKKHRERRQGQTRPSEPPAAGTEEILHAFSFVGCGGIRMSERFAFEKGKTRGGGTAPPGPKRQAVWFERRIASN